MKYSSHYLHVTLGRLRIKIPSVKNSQENARKIERFLKTLNGIKSAKANPFTGNVLVLFDYECIRHLDIVELIRKQGYLNDQELTQRTSKASSPKRVLDQSFAGNLVADIILQRALELTFRRALLALL